MTTNVTAWAQDLTQTARGQLDQLDVIVRTVVLHVGQALILASPVGNPTLWKHPAPAGYVGGHFRANWQYGYNSVPTGVLPDIDASGAAALARMTSGLGPAGGMHYLVNNLPYARRLEYGWSTQAPAGMLGLVAAQYRAWLSEAIAHVNGGTP